ncbi:hypothetical protein BJ166DRAFT_195031 [Pestalotiopsis sp. NC0098]|nr:hypothetical protein BJ166DRAFT_195031 [Pestalotiopsis sp. NC0098]
MALGIKVWHDPVEQDASRKCIIDILAIHGIGTNPDDTWAWKKPGEEANWLQDPSMLAKSVPEARIMRFGYTSIWFGKPEDEPKVTKVADVAQLLIQELHWHRKKNPDRPIIFIAHSFGGLVLLRALRRLHDKPKEHSDLLRYTVGLVSFGTPFRGRTSLELETILKSVALMSEDISAHPETMDLSLSGNQHLNDIVLQYTETRQKYPIPLYCFYELHPSPIRKTLPTAKLGPDLESKSGLDLKPVSEVLEN